MPKSFSTSPSRQGSHAAAANPTRGVRLCSGTNVVLGGWLFSSPWVLSGAAPAPLAAWVSGSVGASIALLALARVRWPAHSTSLSVANLLSSVIGALLIAAFADLSTLGAWNGLVTLLAIALLAMTSALISAAAHPADGPLDSPPG